MVLPLAAAAKPPFKPLMAPRVCEALAPSRPHALPCASRQVSSSRDVGASYFRTVSASFAANPFNTLTEIEPASVRASPAP